MNELIKDVLKALYQPFRFSIVVTILFMIVYRHYTVGIPNDEEHKGFAAAIIDFFTWFATEKEFRIMCCFCCYVIMVLARTLVFRTIRWNPLENILGTWSLIDAAGQVQAEPLENILMFIPFPIFIFGLFHDKVLKNNHLLTIVNRSLKMSFLCSGLLEFAQALTRVGTWQLSDLFHNTLGGVMGGILYWIFLCLIKPLIPTAEAENKKEID